MRRSDSSSQHAESVVRFVDERLGVYDVHEITGDKVVVFERGNVFRGVRNRTIAYRLRDLDTLTSETVQRNQVASNISGLITLLGVVPAGWITGVLLGAGWAIVAVLLWVAIGGFLTLRTPFRMHVISFRTRSGEPAIGLPRAGKFNADRDAFVAALSSAIRAAPPAPISAELPDAPTKLETHDERSELRYVDKQGRDTTSFEMRGDILVIDSTQGSRPKSTKSRSDFRLSDLDPLLYEEEVRDSAVTARLSWLALIVASLAVVAIGFQSDWTGSEFAIFLWTGFCLSGAIASAHTVRRHVIHYRSTQSGNTLVAISAPRKSRTVRDAFVTELNRRIREHNPD